MECCWFIMADGDTLSCSLEWIGLRTASIKSTFDCRFLSLLFRFIEVNFVWFKEPSSIFDVTFVFLFVSWRHFLSTKSLPSGPIAAAAPSVKMWSIEGIQLINPFSDEILRIEGGSIASLSSDSDLEMGVRPIMDNCRFLLLCCGDLSLTSRLSRESMQGSGGR